MLSLLLCASTIGCATTQPVTPEQVVTAYGVSDAATRGQWLVDPSRDQGTVAPSDPARETQRTARWRPPGHPEVTVARADGRWRVTGGVLEGRAAETPAQALTIFSRAITTMDAGLLRGVMPAAERAYWSSTRLAEFLSDAKLRPELLALVQQLSNVTPEHIGAPSAGRVTVGGDDGLIVLVQEPDGWKVLDLKPSERFLPGQSGALTPE